jgi:acyl-CoA synthetase (AMP-forming)/AMP-acid ligase II
MPAGDQTILDRLKLHAREQPDRVAYRFLHEGRDSDTRTYAQLQQRVFSLASYLGQHARPGERALLLYPPGLEFIESFLACLSAGIIAVPAYPPRKNRKAQRLLAIIQDCSPQLILTAEQTMPTIGPELLDGEGGRKCLATDALPSDVPLSGRVPTLDPNHIAFLQYTSGSTGQPRGVMVSHCNILANLEAIRLSFCHSQQSVMVSWLPLFHDMGLLGCALQAFYVGFSCVLLSPIAFLQEPIRWLRAARPLGHPTSPGTIVPKRSRPSRKLAWICQA